MQPPSDQLVDLRQELFSPFAGKAELRRLQREGAVSFPEEGNARVEEFLAGPRVRLLLSTRPPALPVFLYEVVVEPPRAAGASTAASSSVGLFTFSIADHGM